MKRTLTALLTVALLLAAGTASYTASQAPAERTIGIVSYNYEANALDLDLLSEILAGDLEVLPPPEDYNEGTALPLPPAEIVFNVVTSFAPTPADQAVAIGAFLDQGVDGLIVAPVADDAEIVQALEPALLANIPVMIIHRPLTGLAGAKFVGLDSFRVASGWASGASSRGRNFVVIASDLNDPRQDGLTRGFAAKQPDLFMGTTIADTSNIVDVATELLFGAGDAEAIEINYVILADPALTAGTIEAIIAITEGTDRLIKVGSFGVPENKNQYWADKTMHMIVTQDHYNMFLDAALEIKMLLVASDPLEELSVPVGVWTGRTSNNYMSYPYDYTSQLRFTFDRFWR
jgi:ABC-type sugar transport system substrate-binding protein